MKIVFLGNGAEVSNKSLILVKTYFNGMDYQLYIGNDGNKFNFPENYDKAISVLYPYKVPVEELEKSTFINFHPGPLPGYGGRNMAYHAIINNEEYFGSTIHYMDKNFDTGPIIEISKFIVGDKTAKQVFDKCCDDLLVLLKKYLPKFINGEYIESFPQKNSTYYKKTKINDFININEDLKKEIRAKMFPPYFPKIKIGEQVYKIVPGE